VLVDDPKALAGWKSAKRIGRGKAAPTEETVPTPETTQSTAA
jgi:hypothetical protein